MDWFLYLKNLHHKRVNGKLHFLCCYFKTFSSILEFSARDGNPEAYLKPFQTSKTVCFAKIVKPLTIFAKRSMLDVWQCSEYASGIVPNIYRLNPSYFHKIFSAKVSREIIKNCPKEAYITDAIFVILQAISLQLFQTYTFLRIVSGCFAIIFWTTISQHTFGQLLSYNFNLYTINESCGQ